MFRVYIIHKMVLSSSKRTANISSLVNQSQGGGSKKAGFPFQVGRGSWASVHLDTVNPGGQCCTLANMQTLLFPLASISRPVGRSGNPSYWRVA